MARRELKKEVFLDVSSSRAEQAAPASRVKKEQDVRLNEPEFSRAALMAYQELKEEGLLDVSFPHAVVQEAASARTVKKEEDVPMVDSACSSAQEAAPSSTVKKEEDVLQDYPACSKEYITAISDVKMEPLDDYEPQEERVESTGNADSVAATDRAFPKSNCSYIILHNGKFQCMLCPANYGVLKAVNIHFAAAHGKAVDGYACIICGRKFIKERELQRHIGQRHSNDPNGKRDRKLKSTLEKEDRDKTVRPESESLEPKEVKEEVLEMEV